MKCTVCGARLIPVSSDLPLKTSEQTIVIIKGLPVLQCENCVHYLIEDSVWARIEEILASVVHSAELEIIRFAA